MVVFVNCGIVPEQDNSSEMATVTKGHAGVLSQILGMRQNQLLVRSRRKIAMN